MELLVGHNRDEYRLFLALGEQLGRITEEQATAALRMFAPGPDGERSYRAAFPDATPTGLYERVQTDWLFGMPSLRLAEAQTAGRGRAHLYELTWSAPAFGGALGACHGLDIPLLFGTYDADLGHLVFAGTGVPDEARALTARFQAAWTGFARTGNPGWPHVRRRGARHSGPGRHAGGAAVPGGGLTATVGGIRLRGAAAAEVGLPGAFGCLRVPSGVFGC